MIKIIITGSNGLLGQSLLKLLLNEKEKYKVVGFSKLTTPKINIFIKCLNNFYSVGDLQYFKTTKNTMKNDQKISKNVEKVFCYVKSPQNPYKAIGNLLACLAPSKRLTW